MKQKHHNVHKLFIIQSIITSFVITVVFFLDDFLNDWLDSFTKNMKDKYKVKLKAFIQLVSIFLVNLIILYLLKYIFNFNVFDKCGFINE